MKILKSILTKKISLWVLLLILSLGLVVWFRGYLAGSSSDNLKVSTGTTIQYLEKVEEVVFLNAGIQKVVTAEDSTKIFKFEIPLSKKTALMVLKYKAKFGIKSSVKIREISEKEIEVIVPKFEVIGFELDEKKPYELYDKSGELLSYSTKDIDTGKIITNELASKEQISYMNNYISDIQESASEYYEKIIKAVDPEVEVSVKFK